MVMLTCVLINLRKRKFVQESLLTLLDRLKTGTSLVSCQLGRRLSAVCPTHLDNAGDSKELCPLANKNLGLIVRLKLSSHLNQVIFRVHVRNGI
jgi:hypothetical protein